jgi:hypothetical protein
MSRGGPTSATRPCGVLVAQISESDGPCADADRPAWSSCITGGWVTFPRPTCASFLFSWSPRSGAQALLHIERLGSGSRRRRAISERPPSLAPLSAVAHSCAMAVTVSTSGAWFKNSNSQRQPSGCLRRHSLVEEETANARPRKCRPRYKSLASSRQS